MEALLQTILHPLDLACLLDLRQPIESKQPGIDRGAALAFEHELHDLPLWAVERRMQQGGELSRQRLGAGDGLGWIIENIQETVPCALLKFDSLDWCLVTLASPLRAKGVQHIAAGGHAQVGSETASARVVLVGSFRQRQYGVDGRILEEVGVFLRKVHLKPAGERVEVRIGELGRRDRIASNQPFMQRTVVSASFMVHACFPLLLPEPGAHCDTRSGRARGARAHMALGGMARLSCESTGAMTDLSRSSTLSSGKRNRVHTLLIVDDEPRILDALRMNLELEGYQVFEATNGQAALDEVRRRLPDLVVMDVMMPEMDGFEALRELRRFSAVPVVLLTVKADERDVIHGLELGADDYVAKPFSPGVLISRIKAVLRRAEAPPQAPVSRELRVDDRLRIDFDRHEVWKDGEKIQLRPTEFRLLYHLASNPGVVMTHETLLSRVWGPEYRDASHYVRLYINYLRQKLEDDPANPRYILTERGVGYRFADLQPAD